MVSEDIIDIAPAYQRHFRWQPERQSQLIESIFLGIPIPSLFMATNIDGTWELIDGVQRLSTIIRFCGSPKTKKKLQIDSTLKLEGLTKLSDFNGLTFDVLPRTAQLDFLLKGLKVTTLTDKSDMNVRFDLFERLNTGGVVLSNQEIRSCVYRGKFNDFLKELGKDENFLHSVRLTHTQEVDGTREEFVLRFFAFLHNYRKFDHSVIDFLNEFMNDSTKKFNYATGEQIFRKTFSALKVLPKGIARDNRTTTPANLFEGVAVGAALAIKSAGKLNTKSLKWLSSEELRTATNSATNSRAKVTKRIEYCRDKFLGK